MELMEVDENSAEMEDYFGHSVDEIFSKVDTLELKLQDVEQFYSSSSEKQSNACKGSFRKRQMDASQREAAAAKRMQELMRQFGTILRQITQHKLVEPFMEPVDVVGLSLHDYHEIIEKPMDISTIKAKMEAKDGSGYKNVREICTDMRLIFKNAMKYNNEKNDVHQMAKTLLAKFEEKWLQLLPKVDEEEKRRKEEESESQSDIQLAQEATHAKMARELRSELDEVDVHLEKVREMVLQKCRKMSTEEKKRLVEALTRLSPDDLEKALQIVAQNNPSFQVTAELVDLDMDTQSESTLWKLKFFVKEALAAAPPKTPASIGGTTTHQQNNNTRKKEICDALAKTSQKRNKKRHS
jgi:hypothetical protein